MGRRLIATTSSAVRRVPANVQNRVEPNQHLAFTGLGARGPSHLDRRPPAGYGVGSVHPTVQRPSDRRWTPGTATARFRRFDRADGSALDPCERPGRALQSGVGFSPLVRSTLICTEQGPLLVSVRGMVVDIVTLRLFEVEIHHVDLAAGRTIDDWPDELTTNAFKVVVGAFASRADFPSLSIQLDDEDARYNVGHGSSRVVVRGRRADLLAWLLGRSDGRELRVDGGHPLPSIPDLY